MGILRRYDTVEAGVALLQGGEKAYRSMCNLEGLYARGFRQLFGSADFVHPQLRIRVTRDTLASVHMLPALDRMMAKKRRELGLDG
ncbi:MAG TPA: hypothetical protein VM537_17015 [Anaerolineae bacterium]|nr:hypothetical protein [Anaerolineae bacterium]